MAARRTGLVWFAVCCLSLKVVAEPEEWPVAIQALKPTGIRILFPDIPGANLFVFQGNINRYINDHAFSPGDVSANLVVPTDGRLYENLEVTLSPGDVVHYYYYYIKDLDGMFHVVGDQSFAVKELLDPDTDIYQTMTCLDTPTQVLNATVCSNQIIFEDNFDQLQENLWTMEQYIPSEPDYTFTSYQYGSKVHSISNANGLLKIKPTLLHMVEGFNTTSLFTVTSSLNLTDGCTSDLPEECEMEAFGASILPPVVSGRMTSKVAFKYGTVKIRAKLPKGDWLYPDIILQSIHAKHGAHYLDTGVVRIAGARGNSELKGGDVEYGNKVLYGGVMLDVACRSHLISRTMRKKGWGDDFHVFSMRWAPDSMTFFVDGEEWYRVQPAGSLREEFPKECQLPTSGQTKMAPFDDFFRLTLGVAAGGVLEFEDDIVSKDGVKKPWKNAGRKAVFQFWQSHFTWWPTWSHQEELVVDYVKIRAL